MNKLIELIINFSIKNLHANKNDMSLFHGIAGDCLLLYSTWQITNNNSIKTLLDECIDYLILNISKQDDLSFCKGLSGILYILSAFKNDKYCLIDENEFNIRFDIQAKEFISKCHHYELQTGILGLGVYYLERAKYCRKAEDVLGNILKKMCDLYETHDTYMLVPYTIEKHPFFPSEVKWANTGMLHGMTSIVSFFLICLKEGYGNHSLLEKYITAYLDIIANNELQSNTHSFPRAFHVSEKSVVIDDNFVGLFYCNGDLGIINTLILAARTLGINRYYAVAKRAHKKIMQLIESGYMVNNSCFCHGNAGLYYFLVKFNTFFGYGDNRVTKSIRQNLLQNIQDKNIPRGILNGYNGLLMSLIFPPTSNKHFERILLLS